jgi:hypothetical protein
MTKEEFLKRVLTIQNNPELKDCKVSKAILDDYPNVTWFPIHIVYSKGIHEGESYKYESDDIVEFLGYDEENLYQAIEDGNSTYSAKIGRWADERTNKRIEKILLSSGN